MYVIARTAKGRPTLQHKLSKGEFITLCGQDVSRWSRAYQHYPIPQILCKKCWRA